MTDSKQDRDEEEPADTAEDEARIADLVGRVRRSRDPTASLLRPLSGDERGALADRVLASLSAPEKPAAPLRAAARPRRRMRAPCRARPA